MYLLVDFKAELGMVVKVKERRLTKTFYGVELEKFFSCIVSKERTNLINKLLTNSIMTRLKPVKFSVDLSTTHKKECN